MPRYEVISPVKYEGKIHKPGAILEGSKKSVRPLLDTGSVRPVQEAVQAESEPTDSTTDGAEPQDAGDEKPQAKSSKSKSKSKGKK